MKEKLNIKLTEYHYRCGDGCCDHFGTITEVNGKQLELHNQDTGTILRQLLEHLGYEVDIEEDYEYE